MRYRDKKTGAIIVTNSTLGGDWELDEATAKKRVKPPIEEEQPDEVKDEDLEKLSIAELKSRLDELGVTYPTKAKKQDLIEILSNF